MERHEGTLTNQARSKWYNRKMEIELREAEWACVVYDESLARCCELYRHVTDLTEAADRRLAGTIAAGRMVRPVLVRNSLSWERTEWVREADSFLRVTVPPMGYCVVDASG